MPNYGTLFAIDQKTTSKLLALKDTALLQFVKNYTEEDFYEQNPKQTLELGNHWDALHRSLTGGLLYYQSGHYPLNTIILGGQILYGQNAEQNDYLILLKTLKQVKQINLALETFTDEQFKDGYIQIDIQDYNWELGLSDMKQALEKFHLLKEFWQRAELDSHNIIFTLDI